MSLIAARDALTGGTKKSVEPFWGLKVTAKEANSSVYLYKFGTAPSISLEYSIDGGLNWNTCHTGNSFSLANVGDSICFAAPDGIVNHQISAGARRYNSIRFYGNVSVTGSILSLVSKDKTIALSAQIDGIRSFSYLFHRGTSDNGLTEAQLLLHGKNLEAGKYYFTSIFQGQKYLSKIETDITSWDSSTDQNNFYNWVNDIALNGTFICPTALGTQETITRDTSHCPVNWQVVNI